MAHNNNVESGYDTAMMMNNKYHHGISHVCDKAVFMVDQFLLYDLHRKDRSCYLLFVCVFLPFLYHQHGTVFWLCQWLVCQSIHPSGMPNQKL